MKTKVIIIFKALVTIGLLALLVKNIDISETLRYLENFKLIFLFFALCVLIVQGMAITLRWKIVLSHLGLNYSFGNLLRYFWSGSFFNQALPSSIGGDALRGYYIYKNGAKLKDASLSVLIDRLFGVAGLTILVIFMFPFLLAQEGLADLKNSIFIVIFGMSVTIMAALSLDLFIKTKRWRVVRGLLHLSCESRKMLLSYFDGTTLAILSIIVHLCSVFVVFIIAMGMGLSLSWYSVLIIIPLVSLIMVIPISIAGWGVRESSMVLGLGYFGANPEHALALSVAYGLTALIITIPGLFFWLADKK